MSDFIRRELENMPNLFKVLEAHEIRVPNAAEAARRTAEFFKLRQRKCVVHKETNNRYLVMPADLEPLTFVTDRSVTWDAVRTVEVL